MKKFTVFILAALLIALSATAFAATPPIAGVKLSRSQLTMYAGRAVQLKAVVSPEERQNELVTWTSSDESVASVVDGVVMATSPGTAKITATVGPVNNRRQASCTVRVLPTPKSLEKSVRARFIKLNYSLKALSFGKSIQLVATILPSNCDEADRVVTWTSSNTLVATVDENGLVTATEQAGTAIIRATTANGKVAKCKVVVKTVPVKTVTLDQSSVTMEMSETATLTATVKPLGATDPTVTWTSSDESIATVEDGVVTAVSSGKATITAKAGNVSAKCTIKVRMDTASQVTIVAGGDITMGGDPRRSGQASESHYAALYSRFGGAMLGNIDSEFQSANTISIINLECCFTNTSVSSNKTYIFRAKPAYAQSLANSGIDVVNHSNNHMLDFGSVGLSNTKTHVRNNDMAYVCNTVTATIEINGVTVGFCGFNPTGGSVATLATSVIKKLAKKCDIVVASFHWGTDFKYKVSSSQRSLGRAAIKAGADLVLGHHPHVVSGVEKYRGKYIVYSLGTLSSAILTPDDMDTMLYKQTFSVDTVLGEVSDAGVELIPLSMSSNSTTNNANPVKLTGSDRSRVLNKVKTYSSGFTTLPDSCFE
ncbi:MAG: CapA family protein [Clostridia bacterium]|nr:CapA family protein [Clostridia bacterium]